MEHGWCSTVDRLPPFSVPMYILFIVVILSFVSFCFDLFQMNIRGYEFIAVARCLFHSSLSFPYMLNIYLSQLNAIVNFISGYQLPLYNIQYSTFIDSFMEIFHFNSTSIRANYKKKREIFTNEFLAKSEPMDLSRFREDLSRNNWV